MNDRYERVYEVGLLDDLHNYFPALLYQQNSFQSVSDLLGYIRERTERRFNLFDYGRRQYESSMPIPLFPQQNSYVPHRNTHSQNAYPNDEVRVEFTNTNSPSILPLLHSLGVTNRRATTYEDVIVHASQTIIDAASTEETLAQDLESICTICQDRLRQGELSRKLTICGHSFHKTCIDNWLLNRSVRCPTCRHDIRELTITRSTPPSPVVSATNSTIGSRSRLRQRDDDLSSSDIINLLFGRIV